jgi:amidase
VGRRENPRLVCGLGAGDVKSSFFVPHNIADPIEGPAGGPLTGLTAVVKDMYDIAGTRTGGGSPEWLAEQQPAEQNAAVIEKILSAGATITGKAICEELFYSIMGINEHYGMPTNVRAPGRVPGGSSSGSAAACGAGLCDFALGSDTAGSVRIPASFNGLYGLRPTHGRIDLSGAMAMAPAFDTAGWFAGSPGVFRLVGEVLLDEARIDGVPETLIVATDSFEEADRGVAELGHTFLQNAADLLPASHDAVIAPDGFDEWREALRILQASQVWESFGAFAERANPNFGPGIKERIAFASTVTDSQAQEAREVVDEAAAAIRKLVPVGTLIALPSAPSIAPKADNPDEAEMEAFRISVMRLTCVAGLGGLPQVSIPAGTVSGCPAGLSLIGWAGGDEALLNLSVQLATHCGIAID